jgi:hypothetical protein
MDILQFLSPAQAAELEAISEVVEQLKTMELKSVPLDLSSFTINPALLIHAF